MFRDLQNSRAGEIAAIAEVRSSHHVLRVKHLLSELGYSDGTEGVCTTASKRSKTNHEEVKTWERNHVDSQFAKVRVELTREAQAGGDTRHDGRDEVVKVAIGRVVELESSHADIVQSLFILARDGMARNMSQTSLSMQNVSSEFSTS